VACVDCPTVHPHPDGNARNAELCGQSLDEIGQRVMGHAVSPFYFRPRRRGPGPPERVERCSSGTLSPTLALCRVRWLSTIHRLSYSRSSGALIGVPCAATSRRRPPWVANK